MTWTIENLVSICRRDGGLQSRYVGRSSTTGFLSNQLSHCSENWRASEFWNRSAVFMKWGFLLPFLYSAAINDIWCICFVVSTTNGSSPTHNMRDGFNMGMWTRTTWPTGSSPSPLPTTSTSATSASLGQRTLKQRWSKGLTSILYSETPPSLFHCNV